MKDESPVKVPAKAAGTPPPLLLDAAFFIETVCHLQGHEQFLPLADRLRALHKEASDCFCMDAKMMAKIVVKVIS